MGDLEAHRLGWNMLPSPGMDVSMGVPSSTMLNIKGSPPSAQQGQFSLISPTGFNPGASIVSPWVRGSSEACMNVACDPSVFNTSMSTATAHDVSTGKEVFPICTNDLIPSLMSMDISQGDDFPVLPEKDIEEMIYGAFKADINLEFLPEAAMPPFEAAGTRANGATNGRASHLPATDSRPPRKVSRSTSPKDEKLALKRIANKTQVADPLLTYTMIQPSAVMQSVNVAAKIPASPFPHDIPLGKPLCSKTGMVFMATQSIDSSESFSNGVIAVHVGHDYATDKLSVSVPKYALLPKVVHHSASVSACPSSMITGMAWCNAEQTVAIGIVCNYLCTLTVEPGSNQPVLEPLLVKYASGDTCLAGHSATIRSISVSPFDQNTVATASCHGEISLWNVAKKCQLGGSISLSGTISSLTWSNTDSDLLFACTEQGMIYTVHAKSARLLNESLCNRPAIFACNAGLGSLLAGHGDGRINLRDGVTGSMKGFWDPVVTAVDEIVVEHVGDDGSIVIVTGFGGLSIYKVATRSSDSWTLLATWGTSHVLPSHALAPAGICMPDAILTIYDYPLEHKLSASFLAADVSTRFLAVTTSTGQLHLVDCARFPLPIKEAVVSPCHELGECCPAACASS